MQLRVKIEATLILALTVQPALSRDHETARLERLRSEIQELKTNLQADSSRLTSAREQTFELEREIALEVANQSQLEEKTQRKRIRVDALTTKKTEIAKQLEISRDRLANNAVAKYALTLQPKLKFLLNQSDSRKISRNLTYYDYVLHAYGEDLRLTRSRFEVLEQTEAALKLESNRLKTLEHESQRHLDLLRTVRGERTELVETIRTRMADGNARMEQLIKDERHLLDLINELVVRQELTPPKVPFIDLKGELDWPTFGPVANAPGTALRQGGARWSGVLIEAQAGADVKVVANGRVVFADWFRNLGQLVIIDHGGGYMTLYGNNSELHRKPGDDVESGDSIATVGPGDGELPRGLYFELRGAGEPLDPRAWCVTR